MGHAESEYVAAQNPERRMQVLDELFKRDIPCLIISRNLDFPEETLALAQKYKCPLFRSPKITTVLINDITAVGSINKKELSIFSILLNPFAPHVTEEMNQQCALGDDIIAAQKWPEYDESKCVEATVEIAVQVNGKIKAKINIPADCDNEIALNAAKADANVAKLIDGMNIVKEIYVKGKLVNIVVKPMK